MALDQYLIRLLFSGFQANALAINSELMCFPPLHGGIFKFLIEGMSNVVEPSEANFSSCRSLVPNVICNPYSGLEVAFHALNELRSL
jgi:hypothetical protein